LISIERIISGNSRTYTGGIWSQLFLITISWSFAILPYFYNETILQVLHAFFNSLQVKIQDLILIKISF
jgi:hypothetical protein